MGCCLCCLGKWKGELEQRVNAKFLEGTIIEKEIFWANLRHQRSQGVFQMNGNGALVLTSDELWFNLVKPAHIEIEMPLWNIRSVEAARTFGHRALFVVFVDPTTGTEDQVVIALRQPEAWKRIIDETINNMKRYI